MACYGEKWSNYYKNVAMQVAPHSIVARTYGVMTNTIVLILESMIATLVSHTTQFICNYGKSNSGKLVTGMGIRSVYICAILASKRLVNRISGKNLFLYMYNIKNFGNYCISPCCFVNILLYFM